MAKVIFNDPQTKVIVKEKTKIEADAALLTISVAILTTVLGVFSASLAFSLVLGSVSQFKMAAAIPGLNQAQNLTDGDENTLATENKNSFSYIVDLRGAYQLYSVTLVWKDYKNKISHYTLEGYCPDCPVATPTTNTNINSGGTEGSKWIIIVSDQYRYEREQINLSIDPNLYSKKFAYLKISAQSIASTVPVGIYELRAQEYYSLREVATYKPVYLASDFGKLPIRIAPEPVDKNIVAGTLDFEFARLILNTMGLEEDILVSQIQMNLTTGGNGAPYKISNVRLFDGNTQLALSNDPDPTSIIRNSGWVSTFNLATPLLIAKNTSKILSLKADIFSAATTGETYQWGLKTGSKITAEGVDSGETIEPIYYYSDGQVMTVANGFLILLKDSFSAKHYLLPASDRGVPIGTLAFNARTENVKIEKIYLTIDGLNNGGQDQIDKLYIDDNLEPPTILAQVIPTTTDTLSSTLLVDFGSRPFIVQKGSQNYLRLKIDTTDSNHETGTKGASGEGFRIRINAPGDIVARGVISGVELGNYKDITGTKYFTESLGGSGSIDIIPSGPGFSFHDYYLFRNVPDVSQNSLLVGSEKIPNGLITEGISTKKNLYKFLVRQKTKYYESGQIGLYKVSFRITQDNARMVNTFILSDGQSTVAKTPVPSQASGDGSYDISLIFTSDGNVPTGSNIRPYTITGGNSKFFTLKGDISCVAATGCAGSAGTGSIKIEMINDYPNLPSVFPASANSVSPGLLVWTDFWWKPPLGAASPTVLSDPQWTNGAYILSAELDLRDKSFLPAVSTPVVFSR